MSKLYTVVGREKPVIETSRTSREQYCTYIVRIVEFNI